MVMLVRSLLCGVAAVASAAAVPSDQHRRHDQQAARAGLREGRLPLREIERRVVPGMRGAEYLGFDFDPGTGIYTLKFLRNGAVIWVDVDGRTGQVIGRHGR